MSCFDEEPDGDIHGECAAEIHRLQATVDAQAKQIEMLREAADTCDRECIREALSVTKPKDAQKESK